MLVVLYTIIQIIFAIILILFLLFIANLIYNYENVMNIRNSYTIQKEVPIFVGTVNFSTQKQWSYNTYNKNAGSYKDLTPSINQRGGAEYAYNFWMYIDKANLKNTSSTSEDVVLLLRGSLLKIPYINNANCALVNSGTYILTKNPLIRMNSDGTSLIVEYNTVTNPDAYRENGKNVIDCSGTWFDKNRGMLGIYNLTDYVYDKKWFMVTIVLKEINPDDDIMNKNKTQCKMYINGINILDRIVESPYDGSYGSAAMRHNRGPLYVNPGDLFGQNSSDNPFSSTDKDTVIMANLSYFNYAIDDVKVLELFKKKFTKTPAMQVTDKTDDIVTDKFAISPITQDSKTLPLPF